MQYPGGPSRIFVEKSAARKRDRKRTPFVSSSSCHLPLRGRLDARVFAAKSGCLKTHTYAKRIQNRVSKEPDCHVSLTSVRLPNASLGLRQRNDAVHYGSSVFLPIPKYVIARRSVSTDRRGNLVPLCQKSGITAYYAVSMRRYSFSVAWPEPLIPPRRAGRRPSEKPACRRAAPRCRA